jgi:hypothetical protein
METASIGSTDIDATPLGASYWWLVLLAGACSAVLGLLLIFRPFDSVVALAWLVGLFLIISGIASLLSSHRREYGIGIAVLSLVIGVVLFAWPDITVGVIGFALGISALIAGIAEIALSFELKSEV